MERKLLEGLKKYAKNDLVSALSWVGIRMMKSQLLPKTVFVSSLTSSIFALPCPK